MRLPRNETRILLIGRGSRTVDNLLNTLKMISAEILFAEDGKEGIRQMYRYRPEIVICEMSLPDLTGHELCKAVRTNDDLSLIPLFFLNDEAADVGAAFRVLEAGADDLFPRHFNPEHFIAKLAWAIDHRRTENTRRAEFALLKAKQTQTMNIIKDTSELFRAMAIDDISCRDTVDTELGERIGIGMDMVAGLAEILEEQMRTLELWLNRELTQNGPEYVPSVSEIGEFEPELALAT